MVKMVMNRKVLLLAVAFVCLSSLLMASVLVPASPAKASYDYTYKKDSWGNKVSIATRINKYSYSEVEVKAYAKSWGVSVMSWGVTFPMFYGKSLSVRIYGYVRSSSGYWNKVYDMGYYSSRGWANTKTVRWTRIPKGLGRVVVAVTAKYSSIPFGSATISKTMYSYY